MDGYLNIIVTAFSILVVINTHFFLIKKETLIFLFAGDNVDVQDVRQARLRKLAAQNHCANVQAGTIMMQPSSSNCDTAAVVPDQKQTLKRRQKDSNDVSKSKSNEADTNKTLDKSSLLNTACDRKKKSSKAERLLPSSKVVSSNVATSSEGSSIAVSKDTVCAPATSLEKRSQDNDVIGHQRNIQGLPKSAGTDRMEDLIGGRCFP